MPVNSILDPLQSMEQDRRRSLELVRVLEAQLVPAPSYRFGTGAGLAAPDNGRSRPGSGCERAVCYAFESLVLRHQCSKHEHVLFPWLKVHHSDFAAQWIGEYRRTRFQQAYVVRALRTHLRRQPLSQSLTGPRAFAELAELERGLLETQALEVLPIVRGWSPRSALNHLAARFADFDAREDSERRLVRPLKVLGLLGVRLGGESARHSLEVQTLPTLDGLVLPASA